MKKLNKNKAKLFNIKHGNALKLVFDGDGRNADSITQAAFGTMTRGQICDMHKHDSMIEVFYFIKGEGRYKIDGKDYRLTVGDYLRIDPGEMHSLVCTSENLEFFYIGIPVNEK